MPSQASVRKHSKLSFKAIAAMQRTSPVHASLSMRRYLWALGLLRGRDVEFAAGSRRNVRPDHRQGGADHHRAGADIYGDDAFLGLQSGQAVVAQARARHRHLLLVLRAAAWPRGADRAVG